MTPEERYDQAHARRYAAQRAVDAASIDGTGATLDQLWELAQATDAEREAWRATLPPVECPCGREVPADGYQDVECGACGRWLTCGGSELAPVDQWGEETGETWSEAVAP